MSTRRIARLALAGLAALAVFPAAAHATTAPVAAYGFEDSGAVAGDSSVFGNTGTVSGAVRAAGKFGNAMSFDGVNDSVTVADAGSINLASGMTIEAWVKPTAIDGWRTVAIKQRLSNISYGLYESSSTVSTNGEDGTAQFSAPDAGVWSHVAATYDGTTLRAYVDGVLAGSSTARSGPITPGNGPLSIGGNSIWGEWFKGLIDEVRVYDRPLSAAEIQADMTTPVGAPATPAPPSAAQVGSWTAPQAWPMVAVHASMLSDGRVVAWDAFGAAPQSEHVWDPETGQFVSTPSGINLFCSGHVLLPDGRLFVAGGHEMPYVGLRNTMLFNPLAGSWTAGPDMARGRWYPTTTTLPDGRVLIVSGDGIKAGPNDPFFVRPSDTIPELYNPKTNTIASMPSAGRLMPLYPFMFVAPDGRVVDAGPDTTTRLLDTSTGQWSTLASHSPITGGSAVMYRPGKILKTGTWTDTDYGRPTIENKSTVLDLDQTVPAWRSVAPMKWARTYQTLTVLPDGDVLALGGQGVAGANSLQNSPVLQPEIWHPETDTWTSMASSVRPRGYHNTSLLLPDGRILLAGSGRLDGSLMVDEKTAEVYSPPYLSKGPRPTISYAPPTIQWGSTVNVSTPDVDRIAKVSLVRMGAVTHNINMDQRWESLSFRKAGDHLEIDAPASANDAPPGVYYLFLLDDNGVPSKAAILSISTGLDSAAPSVPSGVSATGAIGKVSLSWSASTDNVGVARYSIYRSTVSGFTPGASTKVGSATGTSYTDTGMAAGRYYYRVVAEDQAGNTSAPSAEASADALADTTAPTVSLTAPNAGATVRGTVSLAATATDDVGVRDVQFRVDGNALGSPDADSPYAASWDTTAASAGTHTLTAVARDAAGNTTTSASVTVTVDNSAPAGPTPVAAYAFEDGTGTTLTDVTGKGHTGTIREATWTTGKYGKALNFDGVNDWVTIDDAADLHLSTGMTLEAWVYPTKNTAWRTAIMKERSGDLAWSLYASGSAKPSAWAATSAGMGSTTGPAAPALNTWTHMAAVYDGSNLRLFINGTQAASTAQTGPLVSSTGALRLGGNNIWNEWFAGRLDDVRIYNQALTATQLQTDMNTPAGDAPAADTTAPSVPSGVAATGALGKVSLTWSASTDNVGVARYVVYRSQTSGFTPDTSTKVGTVTTTSFSDSPLATGRYYYRVVAEDQAGNASAPSAEVAGDALADTTPPSVPASVSAASALGRVSLTWSASTDNVGVARYVVYRSQTSGFTPDASNKVGTVATTSFSDSPLATGRYYYRVTAEDQAGNASAPSTEVTGDALADTTAPTVAITAPAAGATVRGTVSVTANANDDVGVTSVQFRLDTGDLGGPDTSSPYSASWDTTAASAGQHTLTAIARDAAGNTTTATNVTVTVDNSVPAGPAPVAAYAFENGTGTTLTDVTGKGHTGTIREATWTTGKYGKALNFDGVNDWVTVDDTADLHLSTAMTLEAWVYPTKNTAWRTAIMKERSGDLAWALYASGTAKPSAWAATSAGMGSTTGPAAPALNTWTHMAAVYDGATLRLFINGTQAASTAQTGPLVSSSGALRLGGNNIWNEWFAGRLDDVRIYNQALTATQLQTDMNTPAG